MEYGWRIRDAVTATLVEIFPKNMRLNLHHMMAPGGHLRLKFRDSLRLGMDRKTIRITFKHYGPGINDVIWSALHRLMSYIRLHERFRFIVSQNRGCCEAMTSLVLITFHGMAATDSKKVSVLRGRQMVESLEVLGQLERVGRKE